MLVSVFELAPFLDHGLGTRSFLDRLGLDSVSDSSTGGPISLMMLSASLVASLTGLTLSYLHYFRTFKISFLNGMMTLSSMAAIV